MEISAIEIFIKNGSVAQEFYPAGLFLFIISPERIMHPGSAALPIIHPELPCEDDIKTCLSALEQSRSGTGDFTVLQTLDHVFIVFLLPDSPPGRELYFIPINGRSIYLNITYTVISIQLTIKCRSLDEKYPI